MRSLPFQNPSRPQEVQRNVDALNQGVDVGSDKVTYPGATQLSDPVTVKHKVGVVPESISLTPIAGASSTSAFVVTGTVTKTQFQVRIKHEAVQAAGVQQSFYWQAFA